MPGTERRLASWYAVALAAAAAGPWYVLILTRRGWSDSEATLLAVSLPLGRLVFGPLWGALADRVGPAPVLRGVAVASAVAAGGLCLSSGPWASAAWLVALSLVRSPAYPLVDALAVAELGPRYGRARAWGSASFLVFGALHGALDEALPTIALWTSALLSVGVVGVTETLPPPPPRGPARGGAWWSDPVLVGLFAVASVHGIGLAVYDLLFALHVEASGMPGWTQGLALVCGVGAEIVLFRTSSRWFPRASAWTWLTIAAAAGVPRFLASAVTHHPLALALLQASHGLHFGLFWLAATALFGERARPEWRNTVLALLPTATFGVGPIVALLASALLLAQNQETPALLVAAAGVSVVGAAGAAALRWAITRRECR